eukprot:SM000112S23987  [mRNA]  locus=s112:195875:196795:+ [translate_table: standard]
MSFPSNYPNNPPSVKFTSEMWHPNVYPDGRVCISILHAPGDDPNGYEQACERWSPVHTVKCRSCAALAKALPTLPFATNTASAKHLLMRTAVGKQVETILLSIISMLSSPNDESPANIDAAKDWRDHREDFRKKVSRIVRRSQEFA